MVNLNLEYFIIFLISLVLLEKYTKQAKNVKIFNVSSFI